MRYELTIPECTPSLNRTQRRHWSHGYKLKKRWNTLVWVARCEAVGGSYTALPHARVTVTRYAPHPIKDHDNLYGGFKVLGDALVSNGLIMDDSMEHIELHMRQGQWVKGGQKRTHVLIEPMTA